MGAPLLIFGPSNNFAGRTESYSGRASPCKSTGGGCMGGERQVLGGGHPS